MRHVSIPCLLLFEDLLLRLKPIIKRTVTDASFTDLKSSCGNPIMELCRHGRCVKTWLGLADKALARCRRCGRGFNFMGLLPCHPARIRSVMERLGCSWGDVKATGAPDGVVA
jgi:hypothetical protein